MGFGSHWLRSGVASSAALQVPVSNNGMSGGAAGASMAAPPPPPGGGEWQLSRRVGARLRLFTCVLLANAMSHPVLAKVGQDVQMQMQMQMQGHGYWLLNVWPCQRSRCVGLVRLLQHT